MFQPRILQPEPDPAFVRQLRKIDPDLRVVWGYQRYFVNRWAIERKIPPERYFLMYASLLESDDPRIIQQPIFDTEQPVYDEEGNMTGHACVGYRDFDLAPDHEWVMFTDHLCEDVIIELKRSYAWERNHPISRLAFEKAEEERKKREAQAKRNADIGWEGVKEGWRVTGKTLQGGQPEKVMEGTEL